MIRTRIGPSHRAAESARPGRPPDCRRTEHRPTTKPAPHGIARHRPACRSDRRTDEHLPCGMRRFPSHSGPAARVVFPGFSRAGTTRFSARTDATASPLTVTERFKKITSVPYPVFRLVRTPRNFRREAPPVPPLRSRDRPRTSVLTFRKIGRPEHRPYSPAPFGPHPAFSKIIILSETENIPRTRNSDAPNEKRKNPAQPPTRQHLTEAINFDSPSHAPLRASLPRKGNAYRPACRTTVQVPAQAGRRRKRDEPETKRKAGADPGAARIYARPGNRGPKRRGIERSNRFRITSTRIACTSSSRTPNPSDKNGQNPP